MALPALHVPAESAPARGRDAVARAITAGQRVTYEEFFDWCDEDTWAEWVDGEVIILSPASVPHQSIVVFLDRVVGFFVELFDLGVLLTAPTQMRLPGRPSGREPDLLFVAKEHLDRLSRNRLDGPADLVVEVVSPESAARDREVKRAEYEAAQIPEYWLLDETQRRADFLALGADGRYHPIPVGEDGVFRSNVLPGFWLCVEWLWPERPSHLAALRELGLIPPATAGTGLAGATRATRRRDARPR